VESLIGTENISDMRPPSSLVGHHARMPLLILSMGITEPLLARSAPYGRRVSARRNAGRDALTQPLQVGARGFLFSHRNTSCGHSTRVGRLTRNVKTHVRNGWLVLVNDVPAIRRKS